MPLGIRPDHQHPLLGQLHHDARLHHRQPLHHPHARRLSARLARDQPGPRPPTPATPATHAPPSPPGAKLAVASFASAPKSTPTPAGGGGISRYSSAPAS